MIRFDYLAGDKIVNTQMPEFGMKVEDLMFEEMFTKAVRIQGVPPIPYKIDLLIVTKIEDITDGQNKPILSIWQDSQEPGSPIFRSVAKHGEYLPGVGWPKWSRVGGFIPGALDPPFKGQRKLKVDLLFVDLNKCAHLMDTPTSDMIKNNAVIHMETRECHCEFDKHLGSEIVPETGWEEAANNLFWEAASEELEKEEKRLGLDPGWLKDKKIEFSNDEFQMWSDRLYVVQDEKQRENILKRINNITNLRSKYD